MFTLVAAAVVAVAAADATEGQHLVNPCIHNMTAAKLPFCNVSLGIPARVADIISRLTTKEKISALGTGTGALPSVGLPSYNWWSEATHGISHVANDAAHPFETNFALPITTAGSFNRTLWYKTGAQIGLEARSFMNGGLAYSTYWAPVINLVRDPRWGRNIETPGEDPYLSGEYATNFVKGFQENPIDPGHIQASACCKHYVANSMESTTQGNISWNRHDFDANVTAQDLVDSYLLPFQACVEKGRVNGLMCSYNAVNGKPSCANPWLLDTVARKEWQFDGYVTSDCDADADVYRAHHFDQTPEETVRDVLRAGTDVDCGGFVQQNAQSALDKKVITMDDIDTRLTVLFTSRMRYGHFDPAGPLQTIGPDVVCSDYAKRAAREGTIQGSVLLKNDMNTLPLDSSVKTVAVIGPNANLSESIASYYASKQVCDNNMFNMVDAIAQYAKVTTALGIPNVKSSDTSGVAAAAKMASAADAVVLAVGQDGSIEHEGHDRVNISLTAAQQYLVSEVAKASKKPVTVVILTGGAVDVAPLLSNDKVGAVFHAGQPSVTVMGVGDLIFGKEVPSGRMVQTIYPASFADEVSIFDFNMRPGPSDYPAPGTGGPATNPGRTHRFYTGKAVIPFGFGLSYTTFKFEVVDGPTKLSLDSLRETLAKHADRVTVPRSDDPMTGYYVKVTNTGKVAAQTSVLGFMQPPNAGKNGVPLQSLFGFVRLDTLQPGASETVYIGVEELEFSQVDINGKRHVHPGDYKVQFGIPETADKGQGFAETMLTTY